MRVAWLSVVGAVLALLGPARAEQRAPLPSPAAPAAAGRLRFITYNVAGLPEGISRSRPLANLPRIGELLSQYDLAVVQEDFAYPHVLRQNLKLPYGSPPFERGERLDFGDGLSQFSKLPFGNTTRSSWSRCNGFTDSYFDCLTPKGFMRSRVEVAPGIELDVYNLHMDAGHSKEDREARAAQLEQLASAIRKDSSGRPVIVGGDFNLSRSERRLLARFEQETELVDACSALRCPEPARIDRVLFRGSSGLSLRPERWRAESGFTDPRGNPLSDHLPVVVELSWRRAAQSG
jgi:endonuclease/exonuclease/phosphatase family metal-dependent hydrolase